MAAPTIDMVANFGMARCQQFIQEELNNPDTHHIDPIRGCWITTQSLTNEGYARRSKITNQALQRRDQGLPPIGREHQTVYLHKIAYTAAHDENIPAGLQSSHLCDNPNCFNPDHIIAETGIANRDRRFCTGVIQCPHHNYSTVLDLCDHNPQCMKVPPTADRFNCCLRQEPIASDPPMFTVSQALAQHILTQDFSDLPGSSLEDGVVVDTDEHPVSGGPAFPSTIADTYESASVSYGPMPSSPPLLAGTRHPLSSDADTQQPPTRRPRLGSSTSHSGELSSTSQPPPPNTSEHSEYRPPSSEEPTSSSR